MCIEDNNGASFNTFLLTARLRDLTQWLDIFSSLTLMRPPKFLALYRRLLTGGGGNGVRGSGAGYWVGPDLNDDSGFDLRMESLSGCPDDVMLAIAEVSALAHWKDAEICNRSLSIRELVRRGDEIERQLRQRSVDPVSFTEVDPVPLHPNLAPVHLNETGHAALTYIDENIRRLAANIFREAVILYLHTVISDNYPGACTYPFLCCWMLTTVVF
jgi:C6 transcription factor Pro1